MKKQIFFPAFLVAIFLWSGNIQAQVEDVVQGELAAGEIRELSTAFSIPPRTVDLCMLRNVSPSAATERFARDVLEKLQGKSVSV